MESNARRRQDAPREKNTASAARAGEAVERAGATLLTSSGDARRHLVGLNGKELQAFPEVADFMKSAAGPADG